MIRRSGPPLVLAAFFVLGATPGYASSAEASGRGVPFQRGVTVGEWGRTAYEPSATRPVLARLSRHHVDTVTLFVVWMQPGASSSTIAPGDRTARTANVVKAIRSARALGLRVILRPYVDLADGGWRGDVRPAELDRWFASYGRFITTFARLAQREKVDGLVVGSEMVSVSGDASRWRALVSRVRRHFRGFVTYQANWDEAQKVQWWGSLDAISISAYFPLARRPDYSTTDLVGGWRQYPKIGGGAADWFDLIERLHRRYRRPVMFGEIGYRTVAGAATRPWDIELAGERSVEAQLRAYDAALRVWYRVPWFRGFHWWYVSPQDRLVRGQPGADHRPARGTLRRLSSWYRRPRR